MKADDNIAINFTYPRNYREAERFLEQQKLQVIDKKQGTAAKADYFVLPKKEGLQIGRDYQQELTDLGKAFQQTSMPTTAAAAAVAAESKTGSAPVAKNVQTLEMLKYWYNQADIQTRKDFQHWVISQQ